MAGKPKPKLQPTHVGSGRPLKFTPERRASILNDIANRIPYEFAAEANGICEETLYDWIRTGKQHKADGIESDYSVFSEAIKRTEVQKMTEHTVNITEHVDKWQADAWMLERRWHKHYGSNASLNELNKKLDKLMESEKNGQESDQEASQDND